MRILDGNTTPTYLGLSQAEWSLIAGQFDTSHDATPEGALELRIKWMNAHQEIDTSKRNPGYAEELFHMAERRRVQRALIQAA